MNQTSSNFKLTAKPNPKFYLNPNANLRYLGVLYVMSCHFSHFRILHTADSTAAAAAAVATGAVAIANSQQHAQQLNASLRLAIICRLIQNRVLYVSAAYRENSAW